MPQRSPPFAGAGPPASGALAALDLGLLGFHAAPPKGLGAPAVWRRAGGRGEHVRVGVVEGGWFLDHQDLAPLPTVLTRAGRAPDARWQRHGAATLGVLAAGGPGPMVGMAPGLRGLVLSRWCDATDDGGVGVADAIRSATGHLQAGDVLLLEVQYAGVVLSDGRSVDGLPATIYPACREAIDTAVHNGIVVVCAAGNGGSEGQPGHDLDAVRARDDGGGGPPASPALHVGATVWWRHARQLHANHGACVTTFAWGHDVHAPTATGDPTVIDAYAEYTGTSAAAALVAGGIALLQSRAIERGQGPLAPSLMAAYLADPRFTTPSAVPQRDRVGRMPALAALDDAIMAGVAPRGVDGTPAVPTI